jgi:hypothetical protein
VTNNTSEALISRNTTAGQLHTFLAKGLLLKQSVYSSCFTFGLFSVLHMQSLHFMTYETRMVESRKGAITSSLLVRSHDQANE